MPPTSRPSRPPASSRLGPGSRVEIQIHPADIRGRVRYLFLTRRQAAGGIALALSWVLFVGAGVAFAPPVVRGVLARHEHRALKAERKLHGERLRALLGRMGELRARADDLRLEVDKIYLAYGLSGAESIGQGGFPPPATAVPESVYAGAIREGESLRAGLLGELGVLGAFLTEIRDFEAAHRERVAVTPSASPLAGDRFVLTSPFGNRRSPFTKSLDFHAGIDLAARRGTEIRAPADGVVTFAGRFPLQRSVGWWRYGNLVVLAHGEELRTLFGHCRDVLVKRGQRVAQGEVLATVGNTGWSTSPHLHYEVRRLVDGDYRPVDPRIYILDHRWRDEERLLVRARSAPALEDYEPLPATLAAR